MSSLAGVAFGPQITAAAQRYRLDPVLLAAVAAQETGGPGVDSGANVVGDGGHGHGLFQIDDRSHPFARTPAAMDPGRNADYAAGLLSGLLQKYGGNVRAALSAYNSGSPTASGTTTDWGNGMRVSYADSVLTHYAELSGRASSVAGGAGALSTAARDAEMPDAPEVASLTNQLRSFATGAGLSAAAGSESGTSAASQSQLYAELSGSSAAILAPSIPPYSQSTQAQRAKSEAPLQQDYYAAGDDDGDAQASSPEGAV